MGGSFVSQSLPIDERKEQQVFLYKEKAVVKIRETLNRSIGLSKALSGAGPGGGGGNGVPSPSGTPKSCRQGI